MPHLHIQCRHCHQTLRVQKEHLGKNVRCPACQSVQKIKGQLRDSVPVGHVQTSEPITGAISPGAVRSGSSGCSTGSSEGLPPAFVTESSPQSSAELLEAVLPDDSQVAEHLMDSLTHLTDQAARTTCPACQQQVLAEETICPTCGFNFLTGLTFEQAAQVVGTRRRRLRWPPWLTVPWGMARDLLRIMTPRGISPTVTGTGMLMVMTLIVGIGGMYVSNNMTGKARHLKVKLVSSLQDYLEKSYAETIDTRKINVIDPVELELEPAGDVQGRVLYTGKLSIVTEGQRRVVGDVEGVFDSGLLFFGLELTEAHLTSQFHLYPDFMTLFKQTSRK